MYTLSKLFKISLKPSILAFWILSSVLIYSYVDKPLTAYFYVLHFSESFIFWKMITLLSTSKIYLALLVLGGIVFRYFIVRPLWEARMWLLLSGIVFSQVLCLILKITVGRARPSLWVQDNIWGIYGFKLDHAYWSMPSGHTTTIMAFIYGLILIYPKQALPLFVGGFLIAFTRVVLLHHYFSDVFVTLYLTLIEMGVLMYFLQKNTKLLLQAKVTT